MAPVLQCPDCGQKHPIDGVVHTAAFPCKGCGRMLKVPPQLLPTAPEVPSPTYYPPPRAAAPMRRAGPRGTELPRLARLGIWIVAVPLGFVLVFGGARFFGFLGQHEVENVFLLPGWSRFWPVARLLPFWALLTTVIVHFGNIGIVRWREKRASGAGRSRGSGRGGLGRKTTFSARGARGRVAPGSSRDEAAPTRTSRVS